MKNNWLNAMKERFKTASQADRVRLVGITVFMGFLFIAGLIGLILPLRPKISDIEKRTLATFPTPQVKTVLNGDFFSDIDTWYADTFPMREQLISANAGFNNLYGLAGEEIHGTVGTGDAIPSTPASSEVLATVADQQTTAASDTPDQSETTDQPSNDGTDATQDSLEASSSSEDETVTTEAAQNTAVDSPYDQMEPEVSGALYIVGNAAYNLYYFNLDKANRYAATISQAAQLLNGTANVYSVLIPTSTGIMLSQEQQDALGCSSSKDAIAYMYSSMSDQVHTIPVYDALMQHRDEYIYFRTDHHWTALGAFYAYEAYGTVSGRSTCKLSDLTMMEFPDFLGTYYASSDQSPALAETPDTVYAYVPAGTNRLTFYDADMNPTNWPIVNDVSAYKTYNKYSCFIGGDNAFTEINNPTITDGSTCLLYKDSYGNPFATFLVNSYQTVYVIDSRYFTVDLAEFVQSHQVQDVIFLNNLESITETTISNLQAQLQSQ